MKLELNIQGYFDITICNLDTENPVSKRIAKTVLNKLQKGDYLIGIKSKTILDIDDLSNPIYSFIIEATENVEYEFDEY